MNCPQQSSIGKRELNTRRPPEPEIATGGERGNNAGMTKENSAMILRAKIGTREEIQLWENNVFACCDGELERFGSLSNHLGTLPFTD